MFYSDFKSVSLGFQSYLNMTWVHGPFEERDIKKKKKNHLREMLQLQIVFEESCWLKKGKDTWLAIYH